MPMTTEEIALSARLTVNERGLEFEENKMQQSIRQLAESLKAIRDKGFWDVRGRPYTSFDDYCQKKLGFTSARASQLITGAGALKSLCEAANGDKPVLTVLESLGEGAIREVKNLPPAQAIGVIMDLSKTGPVTPTRLREVLPPKPRKPRKTELEKIIDGEEPELKMFSTCPKCGYSHPVN